MKTDNTHIAKANLEKSSLINKLFFLFLIIFTSFNTNILFASVKEYYIECKQSDYDSIMLNFSEDIYVTAKLTYNNQVWEDLNLRIRGDGTRAFKKKSLKLKFNNTPFENGRFALNFNAEFEDPSYIRSSLCSRVFREAGVPCFETDFAKLYINGKFIGLFNRTENVDEQFLTSRGMNENANLYKATGEGACLNIVDNMLMWEKKTGSAATSDDLMQLVNDIADASQSSYYDFAQKTFDYENMLKMITLNWLLLNGSTYYHNYYMYHQADANGKWLMLPWDLDKTLSKNNLNRKFDLSTERYWQDNPYLEKAIWNPKVFTDLKAKAVELASTIYTTAYLYPIIDSLQNFIHDAVLEDTCDNTDEAKWLAAIDYDKYYIRERYEELKMQLDSCPTMFRAYPMNNTIVGTPVFKWQSSNSNTGRQVKYKFYISTDKLYANEKTVIYDNIIDTTLTIYTQLENNKKYFWKVEAIDGNFSIEGYENFNWFVYKNGTIVPCSIENNYVMTKANSPYYIDCIVKVKSNASITAQPGVEIFFNDNTKLYVNGKLSFVGTSAEPIKLSTNSYFEYYNEVKIEDSKNNCEFIHCDFTNIRNMAVRTDKVTYSHCNIQNNRNLPGIIVDIHESNLDFNNNTVKGNYSGEGLIAFYSKCDIQNNTISCFNDDIEIIACSSSVISNNKLFDSGDDGIDMNNCTDILIENNVITNINDKGISSGDLEGIGSSNITIKNNMISYCRGGGVSAKNGSTADVINNTFYKNIYNLHANQPLETSTPPSLNVVNCILSSPTDLSVYKDNVSTINVSYSLSDKELIPGTGNVFANPEFVNSELADFNLKVNSPCIDAGNPSTGTDPDGTRKDMGCYPYSHSTNYVVINEINYNSSPNFKADDWIEIYNYSENDIDISAWTFRDSDPTHLFVIPNNTILKRKEYLVLSEKLASFGAVYPNVTKSIGNFNFGLSSQGEYIALLDKYGNIVDSLTYLSVLPWDINANGSGATLQLISPYLDNALASSWVSLFNLGTPGATNKVSSVNEIDKNEIKIFPNPVTNYLIIDNEELYDEITIFNSEGKDVSSQTNVEYNGKFTKINVNELNSGIYLIKYKINSNSYFSKFVKL